MNFQNAWPSRFDFGLLFKVAFCLLCGTLFLPQPLLSAEPQKSIARVDFVRGEAFYVGSEPRSTRSRLRRRSGLDQGSPISLRSGATLGLTFVRQRTTLTIERRKRFMYLRFREAGRPSSPSQRTLRLKGFVLHLFTWKEWTGVWIFPSASETSQKSPFRGDSMVLSRRGRTIWLNAVDLEYLGFPRGPALPVGQQRWLERTISKSQFRKFGMYLLRKFNEHRT